MNGYFLHQAAYTGELLEKWGMADCRPVGSLGEAEPRRVRDVGRDWGAAIGA